MIRRMACFFRPRSLEKGARYFWPCGFVITFFCFGIASYYGLVHSPSDYQQGEMVRFLYLHVPASWFALAIYTLMAFLSVTHYIEKLSVAPIIVKSLAVPGALMTGISLLTGSLWGKPVWGTYWVWDARLTSMLILFFIYLGYLSMAYTGQANVKRLQRLGILVIVGFINIPIIKWSVDFWFTLHQPPSLMRLAKPAIDSAFWPPLLWMTGAYACVAMTLTALVFLTQLRHYRQKVEAPSSRALTTTDRETENCMSKRAA